MVALAAQKIDQLEDFVDLSGGVSPARVYTGDRERQRHVLVDVE